MATEQKYDRMIRVERFKKDLVVIDVHPVDGTPAILPAQTTITLNDVEGIKLYFNLKHALYDQIAEYEKRTTEILDEIGKELK